MSTSTLKGHAVLQTTGLKEVFAAIEKAGGEARIVGGAVRNALLGEPVHEIDLATTLEPEATMEAARAAGLKAHPTGIDHGTVTIVSGHNAFEVTTLRHDVETHGRHATVAFTDDWQADAARRDFTMNALYASLDGEIVDPLGGISDVFNRIIRFAGDAETRIKEDYLRILRFFRFFAQYGNGAPDAAGLAACERLKGGLKQLSRERIGQEMRKLLVAKGAARAAGLMNEAGVSGALFGRKLDDAMLQQLAEIDVANGLAPDYPLRLAAGLPLSAEALGESLRLPNAEGRAIAALRDAMPPAPALRDNERKVVLYQTGAETFARAVRLAWAQEDAAPGDANWQGLLNLAEEWPVPTLPVTGADLIAAGLQPGPELGATLRRLEDWWMAGGFTATKEELLARVST
ncbi:MAG: CCA tRNA nucleotidyltransferase [Anderseniella sp.]|jgi:poly(A) polymerase|nr:CCA tRNA nucleotidyltransferase [Anderseniella sp.]